MRFPVWFSAAVLAISLTSDADPLPTHSDTLTETERYVADQVAKGDVADLEAKFPEGKYPPEKRVLRADFLESILTTSNDQRQNKSVRISGAVVNDSVSLGGRNVNCDLDLAKCHFAGEFRCDHAVVNGSAVFSNCVFDGNYITFEDTKFNRLVVFDDTTFNGIAITKTTQFLGGFLVEGTHFNKPLDFSRNRSTYVEIENTQFLVGADFTDSIVDQQFEASRVIFGIPWLGCVDFSRFRAKELILHSATFQGPACFRSIEIAGNFLAQDTKFLDVKAGTDFSHARIGSNTHLLNTVFKAPVSFEDAHLGNFDAIDSEFGHGSRTVDPVLDFRHVECQGKAQISVQTCSGEMSFINGVFGDLSIRVSATLPKLTLSGTTVHHTLSITSTTTYDLDASFLHVEGPATLVNLNLSERANFTNSKFSMLSIYNVSWPPNSNYLRLYGMTYDLVEAGGEDQAHKLLLTLANKSKYSAAVYTELDTYLTRQGYPQAAAEAFIAGKRRERDDLPKWRPARLGSLLLDWLVGYGRRPEQAGWFCLATIALGCMLFPLKKMELQDPRDRKKPRQEQPRYNRFWYSLGLFLPVVDLKTSEFWGPKKQHRFLRNYVRVHILLGWILVPIFLAAITGLIK